MKLNPQNNHPILEKPIENKSQVKPKKERNVGASIAASLLGSFASLPFISVNNG